MFLPCSLGKVGEKNPLIVYNNDLRHSYENLFISRKLKHWKKLSMDVVESPPREVFQKVSRRLYLHYCAVRYSQDKISEGAVRLYGGILSLQPSHDFFWRSCDQKSEGPSRALLQQGGGHTGPENKPESGIKCSWRKGKILTAPSCQRKTCHQHPSPLGHNWNFQDTELWKTEFIKKTATYHNCLELLEYLHTTKA